MTEAPTREELIGQMTAAAQQLPPLVQFLPILENNLSAARANLTLAEEGGDTDEIEDWRLTVHAHKCAVALNLANQACLNRAQVMAQKQLEAMPA